MLNQLRGRIAVQVDGGMRTGRDVVIGALLGADEFGFATAPLIVEGCIMMRKCHLNTCPVGVATQDPELRKRFTGKPEHVINYFFFVAEEVRELMAQLGFRSVRRDDRPDATGSTCAGRSITGRRSGLDFSRILTKPKTARRRAGEQLRGPGSRPRHGARPRADRARRSRRSSAARRSRSRSPIRNYNRTVGTMLSGRIAERYGHAGLPDDTIRIKASGTAGQSFGAWLAKGVTLDLAGEGNDYVGKGLSGGKLIIHPPADSGIDRAEENIIVGNTVLYGAIAGECYFRGVAGERFAVRNSGATRGGRGRG